MPHDNYHTKFDSKKTQKKKHRKGSFEENSHSKNAKYNGEPYQNIQITSNDLPSTGSKKSQSDRVDCVSSTHFLTFRTLNLEALKKVLSNSQLRLDAQAWNSIFRRDSFSYYPSPKTIQLSVSVDIKLGYPVVKLINNTF